MIAKHLPFTKSGVEYYIQQIRVIRLHLQA